MGALEGLLIFVFTALLWIGAIAGIGMQDASYDQEPTQIECKMHDDESVILTEGKFYDSQSRAHRQCD